MKSGKWRVEKKKWKVESGKLGCVLLVVVSLISCGGEQKSKEQTGPAFSKATPQDLSYENTSGILKDMKLYTEAVKKLDNSTLQTLDKNYQGVQFITQQKPLFLNVYPDPAGGKIIFLLVPKDPATGSSYLLTFDKKLPVIDSETVELQIRTKDPEKPLTCTLPVPDSAAYMTEYPSHQFVVEHRFTKRFLQSGTYDFDALTVPGYRPRGYAFISLDLAKSEVKDQTANLTASCVE